MPALTGVHMLAMCDGKEGTPGVLRQCCRKQQSQVGRNELQNLHETWSGPRYECSVATRSSCCKCAARSILITLEIPAICSPDTAGSVGGSVRAHGFQAEQGVPDEGAICRDGGACNPRLITAAPILLLVKCCSRIP